MSEYRTSDAALRPVTVSYAEIWRSRSPQESETAYPELFAVLVCPGGTRYAPTLAHLDSGELTRWLLTHGYLLSHLVKNPDQPALALS